MDSETYLSLVVVKRDSNACLREISLQCLLIVGTEGIVYI